MIKYFIYFNSQQCSIFQNTFFHFDIKLVLGLNLSNIPLIRLNE